MFGLVKQKMIIIIENFEIMFDVCAQNLLGNRNGSSARILQLHAQSMRCMQQ